MLRKLYKNSKGFAAACLLVIAQLIQVVSPLMPTALAAAGDPILIGGYSAVDENGPNDEPGQKDLTQMSTKWNGDGTVTVAWSWDDTAWSGGNTGDACILFDNDGNGFADYAVCTSVGGTPAALTNTTLYLCEDNSSDTCTGPVYVKDLTTACSVAITPTNPFNTQLFDDTTATCTVQLSDVSVPGGDTNLLNVCSYPSRRPNSDASDCIRPESTSYLKVVKDARPDTLTDRFDFYTNGVYFGTTYGSGSVTNTVKANTPYSLTEVMPAGWTQMSIVCDNGQQPGSITVRNNQTVTCTIVNSKTLPDPIVPIINPCGPTYDAVYGDIPVGNYTYVRNTDGSITFTATAGYVFSNDTTSFVLPAPADDLELCDEVAIPQPVPVDPCGIDIDNAYWDLAALRVDYPDVSWQVVSGELIGTAIDADFVDGRHSINFGAPTDSGLLCVVTAPEKPAPVDPCNINEDSPNAYWVLPRNSTELPYTWSLVTVDGLDHLVVTLKSANDTFVAGQDIKSIDFGVAADSGELCPAPTIVQPTCTSLGSMTLPVAENDGFTYRYEVRIGLVTNTYEASELPTTINGIAQGTVVNVSLFRNDLLNTEIFSKEYRFDMLNCIEIPAAPEVDDPCGPDNAEWVLPEDTDEVIWSINEDGELIATAQGSNFTDGMSTHNYGLPVDSLLECGKGSVDIPVPTPSTPLPTPVVLPHTGGSFDGLLAAFAAATATYGAVYFAQGKRR